MAPQNVQNLLGQDAEYLLGHNCKTISREMLHLPGPDFIDRVFVGSNRPAPVLNSLHDLFNNGRLSGTGYMSILPVDQGIEHSAGASFAPNPIYFDPEKIVELAIEGGCNAVASTYGALGSVARKYAHKIPFVVKINHNELLTYPNTFDQIMFGTIEDAWNMGAKAVVQPFILVQRKAAVRSSRWLRPSNMHANWAWPPSCGATLEIQLSRSTERITTHLPILPGKPIIWVPPFKPTSSSRKCPTAMADSKP